MCVLCITGFGEAFQGLSGPYRPPRELPVPLHADCAVTLALRRPWCDRQKEVQVAVDDPLFFGEPRPHPITVTPYAGVLLALATADSPTHLAELLEQLRSRL
jgi:hypothetical protein